MQFVHCHFQIQDGRITGHLRAAARRDETPFKRFGPWGSHRAAAAIAAATVAPGLVAIEATALIAAPRAAVATAPDRSFLPT